MHNSISTTIYYWKLEQYFFFFAYSDTFLQIF